MRSQALQIVVADVVLDGDLAVPDRAAGVVAFAHGSGSSRHSPRNQAVAADLCRAGFATLLLDLLTVEEDRDESRRFAIDLLAARTTAAVDWLAGVLDLPTGLFGASTGAAAALVAAGQRPEQVRAVVSRGGRPDLAGDALAQVRAPTLLIVGGRDELVLELNRQAAGRLTAPYHLEVIPGATHLFPEPGALERVSALAADWFRDHLHGSPPPPGVPR